MRTAMEMLLAVLSLLCLLIWALSLAHNGKSKCNGNCKCNGARNRFVLRGYAGRFGPLTRCRGAGRTSW